MQVPVITKYGFRIRTRAGMVVDHLLIHGRDEAEARRKLAQMYRDCEVLECVCHAGGYGNRGQAASYEEVLGLITQ